MAAPLRVSVAVGMGFSCLDLGPGGQDGGGCGLQVAEDVQGAALGNRWRLPARILKIGRDERPFLTPWTDGSYEDRAWAVLQDHWSAKDTEPRPGPVCSADTPPSHRRGDAGLPTDVRPLTTISKT